MMVWKCFDCDYIFDEPRERIVTLEEPELQKCCPKMDCRSVNTKKVYDLENIDFTSFGNDSYDYYLPEDKKINFGDIMLEIGRLIFESAKGGKVTDVDGNEYIDML